VCAFLETEARHSIGSSISEQDIFTFHYFASRIFYSFYDRLTYKDIKKTIFGHWRV